MTRSSVFLHLPQNDCCDLNAVYFCFDLLVTGSVAPLAALVNIVLS